MEAAVCHLKEALDLTYHEIAVQLNRDDRTIWTEYNRAVKKRINAQTNGAGDKNGDEKRLKSNDEKISKQTSKISVPVSVFQDRAVSFMESVAFYLKNSLGLTYHEIAVALNRDDRTIWTVYKRAEKKRGGKR
jgi:IS30 family transposase